MSVPSPYYPVPHRRRRRFPAILASCAAVLLAICCAGTLGAAYLVLAEEPDPPVAEAYTPQPADAQAFEETIRQAEQQARETDQFSVAFTEQQISSWLAYDGREYALQHGYSFPFEDIQVGVDDGYLSFYSTLTTGGLNVPLMIAIEPYVHAAGHLAFTVDEAQLGGLPVPPFILNNLVAQAERLLTEPVRQMRSDYAIDPNTLSADDGVFRMSGALH